MTLAGNDVYLFLYIPSSTSYTYVGGYPYGVAGMYVRTYTNVEEDLNPGEPTNRTYAEAQNSLIQTLYRFRVLFFHVDKFMLSRLQNIQWTEYLSI